MPELTFQQRRVAYLEQGAGSPLVLLHAGGSSGSGHHVVTERGVEALNQRTRDSVLSQQSEEFRRHRLAFERLLELTLQRMRPISLRDQDAQPRVRAGHGAPADVSPHELKRS